MQLVSLGFRTDLALLQSGGSEVEDRGDHLVVRSPHNPTHWWGNFLLLENVPAPENCGVWLERFEAAFPVARHVALGFDGTYGCVSDLDWFAERGFDAEAQTVMTATKVHRPAHFNPEAVCRHLVSDDDWVQSIELRMRCDDRFVDRPSHRRFVVAKAETNRKLIEVVEGPGSAPSWTGSSSARWACSPPAQGSHVSSRSRQTRTFAAGASPDHSCITPAFTASTSLVRGP